MLIFAYGSNLCMGRLKGRVPSARVVTVASLAGYALKFHKRSRLDGSGKADAYKTDRASDVVWGVVYEIDPTEKPNLDKAEGLGAGYDEKAVTVKSADGTDIVALVYVATDIDPDLVPYGWYKAHVVRGARQHGLPEEYVKRIEMQASSDDLKQDRVRRERSVEC